LDCCRKLVAEGGSKAFFMIGLRPTLWRNCVWNAVYFGLMDRIRHALPPTSSALESSVQTFGSGFVGAIFATCFNAPFDVVKVPFSSVRVRYLGTMDEN
jgi:hypothetical protein